MRHRTLSVCYTKYNGANSIQTFHGSVHRKHSTSIQDAKPYKSIPGLSSLPYIGALHHFLPVIGEFGPNLNFVEVVGALHRKFGPVVKMNGVFARADMVILYEPELIDQVFRSQDSNPWRPGFETMEYYREVIRKDTFDGIYGLTTAQGPQWRDFRTKVNPAMLKPKLVKVYAPTLNEIAQDFVKRLKEVKDDKQYLEDNFMFEVNKFSLESLGFVGLGDRLGCFKDELTPEHPATKLMQCAKDIVTLSFYLEMLPNPWKYFATPGFKKLMRTYDIQLDISKVYIEQAKKRITERGYDIPEEDKSIIEKLLAIDVKVANVMANEMLFAGIDTVTFGVINVLYHLANNPDKQEKLREEIRLDSTHKRYLRACIKEALRIWSVVPSNLRRTDRDHVVGGYHIPPGIDVIAPNEYLSSLDEHYPRAKEFLPERWLVDKSDPLYYGNAHPMITLPFGFGIRSCIGRRIAELEIEILLKNVLNEFKITWEGAPIKIVNKLLNYFEKPFNFRFQSVKK